MSKYRCAERRLIHRLTKETEPQGEEVRHEGTP